MASITETFHYLLKNNQRTLDQLRITSSSFCWRCFCPQSCTWTRAAWWGAAATAPAGRARIWRRAASAPATSEDQPAASRETDRKGCDSGWGAAWWRRGSRTGWQESWSTDSHLTGQEKWNYTFFVRVPSHFLFTVYPTADFIKDIFKKVALLYLSK